MLDKPTDAMIEAGRKAFRDPFAGDTAGDILRQKLCSIYLAMKALDATLTPDPVQSDGEGWETFSDASYFDMWCVRKVGQRTFGQGFHLVNGDEAQDLADLLTRLTSLSAPVEKD